MEKEKVEIELTKKIKGGYIGTIVRILEPHQKRRSSACRYMKCGGCNYNHIDYEAQQVLKQRQIEDLFHTNGYAVTVHPPVMAKEARGYRNKSIFTFQKTKKKPLFGFYEENTHYVQHIETCLNHDDCTNKIFQAIYQLAIKFKIEIYDEDRKTGILRHVLIRRAKATNQTLVCLVVSKEFKGSKNFVQALVRQVPEISTVVMNFNSRSTSVVLGDKEKILYGKGFIVDELCGHTYKLSARTFYQINHDQCELLYQKAIDLCHFSGKEIVFDMFCGIGTIGMSFANQVKEVVGVEINAQSIQDAKMNAKMNNINNIRFVCSDASQFMKQCAQRKQKVDVVIMDPPRSGSDQTFIDSLAILNPKQVVYISCNPQTQVRDLQWFKQHGYTTKEVFLYDLFPYSAHVESVCLLEKNA